MLCNRNQLSKESGLEYPFVERVIKKTGLKKAADGMGGRPMYELSEFTAALETYRELMRHRDEDKQNDLTELEDERLREIIRGLKLKNNILAGKLIEREQVYTYISSYISEEVNRVKRLCLQQLVLKGRNKSPSEIRQLGMELFNDYLAKQKQYAKDWFEKTGVDEEESE